MSLKLLQAVNEQDREDEDDLNLSAVDLTGAVDLSNDSNSQTPLEYDYDEVCEVNENDEKYVALSLSPEEEIYMNKFVMP